jgi:hypothetical protein
MRHKHVGVTGRQVIYLPSRGGSLRIIGVVHGGHLGRVCRIYAVDALNLLLLIGILLYNIIMAAAQHLAVRSGRCELARWGTALERVLLPSGARRLSVSLGTVRRRRVNELFARLPQLLVAQMQVGLQILLRRHLLRVLLFSGPLNLLAGQLIRVRVWNESCIVRGAYCVDHSFFSLNHQSLRQRILFVNGLLLSNGGAETATILGLVLNLVAHGLALRLLVATIELFLGECHAPGIAGLILLGIG